MKLRTQLILAFLLLAILPMAALTLYSYVSSISTLRQAIEAEALSTSSEMGGRFGTVHQDLNRTVERLGRFPFRQLMDQRGTQAEPENTQNPLLRQLMSEMGSNAFYFESLEIQPSQPGVPSPPFPKSPTRRSKQRPDAGTPQPLASVPGLVIEMRHDPTVSLTGNRVGDELPLIRPDIRFHVAAGAPVPPDNSQPNASPTDPGWKEQRNQAAVVAQTMRAKLEQKQRESELISRMAGILKGQYVTPQLQDNGQTIGTLRAQVNPQRILSSILGAPRRRKGEIPFVCDAGGKLYTAQSNDQDKLKEIPSFMAIAAQSSGKAITAGNDWLIVARKDTESGLTFGMARPVGESLQELRRTAVRNFMLGLGIIAVALAGIIPISNRMTRNLHSLAAGVERLAHGETSVRVELQSKDEFGKLAASFNRMAQEIQEHQKQLVEQERIKQELDMCRQIQETMLPHVPFQAGPIQIKGVSIPAREVGGDFFNYFPLQGSRVAILLGDVSGKGLPAALLMANLQAGLQARCPLQTDLARLAECLDAEIYGNTPAELFVTLFMGILDPEHNLLHYVSAGHGTQIALYQDGHIERLESTGRPLGLLPDGTYEERTIRLSGGDSLFLFTDGLVESFNASDEEFGMERLETLLQNSIPGNSGDVLVQVEQALQAHRGNREASDDAAMLLLHIAGSS